MTESVDIVLGFVNSGILAYKGNTARLVCYVSHNQFGRVARPQKKCYICCVAIGTSQPATGSHVQLYKVQPPTWAVLRRYDQIIEAVHGSGYLVKTARELEAAVKSAFSKKEPALINVVLDPFAGVESGNVHSFNAPKSNL
jgi:hypothetical protein